MLRFVDRSEHAFCVPHDVALGRRLLREDPDGHAVRRLESEPAATGAMASRVTKHGEDPSVAISADDEAYLRRIASSLIRGSAHDVDDLVQDALLRAARSSVVAVADRRNWLRTIARRLWYSRLRRSQRVALGLDRTGAREPIDPVSLEDGLARRELIELIHETIARIAEPYRTVLVLRFRDDLEPSEIADRLGRSCDTVSTQLRRGLALMREALDRECGGDRDIWFSALSPLTSGLRGSGARRTRFVRRWFTARAASVAILLIVASLFVIAPWKRGASDRKAAAVAANPPETPTSAPAPRIASAVPTPTQPDRGAIAPTGSGSATDSTSVEQKKDPDSTTTIDLLVVDAGGSPVADASVEILHASGYGPRLRTARDGSARLDVLESDLWLDVELPNTVVLSASAQGFERSRDTAVRFETGERFSQRITLLGPATSVVAHLLHADLTPVRNRRVWIRRLGRMFEGRDGHAFRRPYVLKSTSNGDGDVRFEGLGPGEFETIVFLDEQTLVESRLLLEGVGQVGREIVLPEPSFIVGVARDDRGSPVAGARVVSVPETPDWLPPSVLETFTDDEGNFRLPVLPRPQLGLRSMLPGENRVAAQKRVTLGPGDVILWDPVLPSRASTRSIAIRVMGRDGGDLAGWSAGLYVRQNGKWFELVDTETTDAKGRATLHCAQLEEGLVQVSPSPVLDAFPSAVKHIENGTSGEVSVVVGADDDQRCEIRVQLEAEGWAIVDARSVELACMQYGVRRTFSLSGSGQTRVAGLLPGSWQARVLAGPSLVCFRTFDILAGEAKDLGTITLQPPGGLICRFPQSSMHHSVDVVPKAPWGADYVVARWEGNTVNAIPLLEGDYGGVPDGDVSRAKRFHIESGRTIEVLFDP